MTAAADPYFQRLDNLDLYALSSRGEAAAPDYWAGYRAGIRLTPGQTVPITAVWEDIGGVYLFCGRPFPHAQTFLAALDAWIATHSPTRDVRYLWLDDPNRPVEQWRTTELRATRSTANGITVWQLTRDFSFVLSGHNFVVAMGSRLGQELGSRVGFWLQQGGVRLVTPQATYTCEPTSTGIPLSTGGLGGWTTNVPLASDGNPTVASLAAQIRYCLTEDNGVRTVAMPLLRPQIAPMAGVLTVDPVWPTRPERTAITLRAAGTGNPLPLESYLRTPLGHVVTLTPQPASPWPSRLVFNVSPATTGPEYYLTPNGAFLLRAPGGERRLALGLSGLEYVDYPTGAAMGRFVAGQPACANTAGTLTDTATTAYLDVLPDNQSGSGLGYFAQPELAPWFAATATDGFLPSASFPVATLPGWPATPSAAGRGVPVGCYSGIAAAASADAARLEEAVLAPARRAAIAGAAPPGPSLRCVTQQGMLARVAAGEAGWDELVVGAQPEADITDLAFTDVSATLRGQLGAPQLFLVVSNVKRLTDNASVRYRIDPAVLARLESQGMPRDIVGVLQGLLAPLGYPIFETAQDLQAAVGPYAGSYLNLILSLAGRLKLTMDGWTFQLSPHSWRTGEDSPTIMVVKLAGRSFAELVAQPSSWSWPEPAADRARAQGRLADIVKQAAAASPNSPEGRFYREIVTDPRWSGVLFFNANIDAAELPDEMRFVTAGIDTTRFFAHHVALSHTPLTMSGNTATLGHTAVSALIRYVDDTELAPTTTVPFAFVTQRLEAQFTAGALVDMSARVQLVLNELFGSRLTRLDPVGGNSLTINGSYQFQDGVAGYRFGLDRRAVYQTASAVLRSIEILDVAVRTRRAGKTDLTLTVEFGLDGNLRFSQLTDFDLFSFGPPAAMAETGQPEDGYLRFRDLTVTMTFPVATPTDQTFTSDEQRLRVDLPSSRARRGSLVAGFPLTVTGVVAVAEGSVRPDDLGYAPVLAPLDQVPLRAPWFGLAMRLDLGTLGSLADAAGMSATLLAAWMPDGSIYCGLKMPGPDDSGWPVQGLLRLSFRGYEFLVDRSGVAPAYLLRMSRLALSALGLSLPPGQLDLLVFGDPQSDRATALGWYGAYTKEGR